VISKVLGTRFVGGRVGGLVGGCVYVWMLVVGLDTMCHDCGLLACPCGDLTCDRY